MFIWAALMLALIIGVMGWATWAIDRIWPRSTYVIQHARPPAVGTQTAPPPMSLEKMWETMPVRPRRRPGDQPEEPVPARPPGHEPYLREPYLRFSPPDGQPRDEAGMLP
jgi:hypothetical protein